MLQKIFNIKKLFLRHKPEAHVSTATVHGTRSILHVANLSLFGVVIMLTIASSLIYYLMPVTDVFELSKMIEVQEVETFLDTESVDVVSKKEDVIENEAFSVISARNVFSNERKEWVVKAVAVIPKAFGLEKKKLAKRALAKKKAQAGKPKKIILHGIVIAGSIKKALINNPLKGVSKKKTMYVEEGDELEGYKVTSIERDRIKLDWHGEEIVVTLYSGLKDLKQGGNAGKIKPGGLTKLDYKFKVVEDAQAEKIFDVDDAEVKKVAHGDILDETSLNLVYKEPEYFLMPIVHDIQLSEVVEMEDAAEISSDFEFNDVDFSKEKREVVKCEILTSVDLAREESFNVGDAEVKKVAQVDIHDETSFNLVYKEPEYFFMPVLDDVPLSEMIEMQEGTEISTEIEFNDVDIVEEKQEVVKTEIPTSVDLVADRTLKQKILSGKPIEIVLHGIVIAGDIKKALVGIPMSDIGKDRTLYVNEGDGLAGYKVTSIEPDRLRLDWHGEEMVVKFPPL